ncbi:tyrosine-type recombinase/integrase [Amycolatopsis japonica]
MTTNPAREGLLQAARACDDAFGRFTGDEPGQVRAGELLTGAAKGCRDLAAALDTDPTLATEPSLTGRLRSVDLVVELTRQLRPLLVQAALDDSALDRWGEAEALAARLHELVDEAIATVPLAEHATEAGSRQISRARLAAQDGLVRDAAAALRAAVDAALQVPYPDPLALSLDAIASQLERHHADLADGGTEDGELLDPDRRAELAAAGELLIAEDAAPAWARPTIDAAALWLHTAYGSANTKKAHANALGIPRADQRLWRGEPTHRNVVEVPAATAFFPWCVAMGLDPHTDMTRERLRAWLTIQDEAKVAKTTQKARLGAVSAWYREMRYQGKTSFEVPAALPQEERRTLGVLKPAPATPTVPVTMGQVRALRISAERYPGPARRRYRTAVAVLTTTGIRAEELCALNRGDLHRAGPDGTPALWIDGKGRKRRWVKLPRMAVELLEDYLAERDIATVAQVPALPGQVSAKPAEQPLFTTATGTRLGAQQVTDMLRYLCRYLVRAAAAATSSTLRGHAAQLRPIKDTIHPHSTRHFYAITAENNGVPIRQISLDLGHSSVAVTEAYLEHARALLGSAATIVADLITAGEDLALMPGPN